MTRRKRRLIESDAFPIEYLSRVAERESWRKEIHRPIYHVHKWWANRLGSIFRGILLGSALEEDADLETRFRNTQRLKAVVFDPFLGSGTTIGEAHKLGMTALGRDINPVAVNAVRTALGPLDRRQLEDALRELSASVGEEIRGLYRLEDEDGLTSEVLYYFWVMQIVCPSCVRATDLFPTFVFAKNAYPGRKPEVKVVCPGCGEVFESLHGQARTVCPSCRREFSASEGNTNGSSATCLSCEHSFRVLDAFTDRGRPPEFRLYAKLVLLPNGSKRYSRATDRDRKMFDGASRRLREAETEGRLQLPDLALTDGYNTKQAMRYGFVNWRHFFNERQLLALALLRKAIQDVDDEEIRQPLLTLFSGLLEFNNLFASYKGEGTGAVRHMFSHHILKPERMPIEANVWGTQKSSGSFIGLFRSRLLRALDYRECPTEIDAAGLRTVSALPFSGKLSSWPSRTALRERGIYLSCGDSSDTGLPPESVDFVVTDPPFFDNVHYSELADFFHAWQRAGKGSPGSTRRSEEVQDSDPMRFGEKLTAVFRECRRLLKPDGLLVFSYHHSREDGWKPVAAAIFDSGFSVVNAHPVKSEMSVAAPKAQAKSPIQLDVLVVCRKGRGPHMSVADALDSATEKVTRLERAGISLSTNDVRVCFLGQMLSAAASADTFVEGRQRAEEAAARWTSNGPKERRRGRKAPGPNLEPFER
jgi:putative DNA methylase